MKTFIGKRSVDAKLNQIAMDIVNSSDPTGIIYYSNLGIMQGLLVSVGYDYSSSYHEALAIIAECKRPLSDRTVIPF